MPKVRLILVSKGTCVWWLRPYHESVPILS